MANNKKAAFWVYVISTILGALSGYFGLDGSDLGQSSSQKPTILVGTNSVNNN